MTDPTPVLLPGLMTIEHAKRVRVGWAPTCMALVGGPGRAGYSSNVLSSCGNVTTHVRLRGDEAGAHRYWASVCPEHAEGDMT